MLRSLGVLPIGVIIVNVTFTWGSSYYYCFCFLNIYCVIILYSLQQLVSLLMVFFLGTFSSFWCLKRWFIKFLRFRISIFFWWYDLQVDLSREVYCAEGFIYLYPKNVCSSSDNVGSNCVSNDLGRNSSTGSSRNAIVGRSFGSNNSGWFFFYLDVYLNLRSLLLLLWRGQVPCFFLFCFLFVLTPWRCDHDVLSHQMLWNR